MNLNDLFTNVARFEKVSYETFKRQLEITPFTRPDIDKDLEQDLTDLRPLKFSEIKEMREKRLDSFAKDLYNGIIKPRRATEGSAGYDFFSPISFTIPYASSIVIPTGIRCYFNERYPFVLKIYPKSGLSFKYGMQLANTVGIIDSDYYHSDNEGHIMIKLTNPSYSKDIIISKGQSFVQGIFELYGITEDDADDPKIPRNGGFGSTSIIK